MYKVFSLINAPTPFLWEKADQNAIKMALIPKRFSLCKNVYFQMSTVPKCLL